MNRLVTIISLTWIALSGHGQNPYEVHPKRDDKIPQKVITAEEKFIKENFPFIHLTDWKPGMRFMVRPVGLVDSGFDLKKYKEDRFSTRWLHQKAEDYQGKIFKFVGLEERQLDYQTLVYAVFECEGEKFEYESSYSTINEMRKEYVSINNITYIDEIDKAREILINKKFYILKDYSTGPSKWIPVIIKNIGMASSNSNNPITIIYSTESGEEDSDDITLSRTNTDSKRKIGVEEFYEVFLFKKPSK